MDPSGGTQEEKTTGASGGAGGSGVASKSSSGSANSQESFKTAPGVSDQSLDSAFLSTSDDGKAEDAKGAKVRHKHPSASGDLSSYRVSVSDSALVTEPTQDLADGKPSASKDSMERGSDGASTESWLSDGRKMPESENPAQAPTPAVAANSPPGSAPGTSDASSNSPTVSEVSAVSALPVAPISSGSGVVTKVLRVFTTMPIVQELSPENGDHLELQMEDVIGEMPTTPRVRSHKPRFRPSSKKSLFPVQRVAIIVTSREAAKSFFFQYIVSAEKKEENFEKVKKKYPFATYILTRPLDRKHNYF